MRTTMIQHVLNPSGKGVWSPEDALIQGGALRSYNGIMSVCIVCQCGVVDRVDKPMDQQKNCAGVGTRYLWAMPVSILNSYV